MLKALCGWLGPSETADPVTEVIDAMGRALLPAPAPVHVVQARADAALAATGPSPDGCTHIEAALGVAICGTPRWADDALARRAREVGMAVTLLEAYRACGREMLGLLHGSFALAVVDGDGRRALLATDRMGVYPLWYALDGRGVVAFASSATGVRAHPRFRTDLDPGAVYAYLYFHVVPGPLAIFAGQQKLLPGEYVSIEGDHVQRGVYWDPRFEDNGREPVPALEAELRSLLRTAVGRCAPDARTGAFLSGGLDSSTVAGILAEIGLRPAKTFSIGFDVPGYDEMPWARISAKHFGTEAHEYYVTPADVAESVIRIAQAYDEPFGNSSAVPAYLCARFARDNGIALMLAGDGGDELFGGNARYAKQKVFEIYSRLPPVLRRGVVEPLLYAMPTGGIAVVRKARSYVEQARVPMPERLQTYNFLHRTPVDEVLAPDFRALVDPELPLTLMRETYARARSRSLVNRMLFLDWKFTLADNDLRKVSRMCELAGVDVRYPLLDDELIELSTRVPARLKVKGTTLRYFYKQALRDFLPPEVIAKSKHGFGLPFGLWMRDYAPLRELAHDSLERFARRGYVRREYLERLLHQHEHEHAAYYGEFVWVLMMLELWLQRYESA